MSYSNLSFAEFYLLVLAKFCLLLCPPLLLADEIFIDLQGVDNPCEAMRQGFNEYWKKNIVDNINSPSLKISGAATIKFEDLVDLGEYKLCAGLGRGLYDDELDLDKIKEKKIKFIKSVTFDNVILSYNEKNQTKPAVLFQWGSFYNAGWDGKRSNSRVAAINVGGHFKGDLTIQLLDNKSIGWKAGKIPGLPFTKKNISETTTVGWFETGIHRADMTRLSLTIEGQKKDYDNIGVLHQHSWGVRRGPIRVENLGVGLLFYGNSVGSVSDSYIHRNAYGLVLGDFRIGGDVQPSPNCLLGRYYGDRGKYCERRNLQVVGLVVNDSVIEGNDFGNLIINDAAQIEFNSVHLEMALIEYQKGHGVLIGGGSCGKPDNNACGSDFDCKKGACKFPDRTINQNIRFYGGIIAGDRFSNEWDGIVIGGNAKQGKYDVPQIIFENRLKDSDLNPDSQFDNRCFIPGVLCGIVSYRTGATIKSDFSRAVYKKGSSTIGILDK